MEVQTDYKVTVYDADTNKVVQEFSGQLWNTNRNCLQFKIGAEEIEAMGLGGYYIEIVHPDGQMLRSSDVFEIILDIDSESISDVTDSGPDSDSSPDTAIDTGTISKPTDSDTGAVDTGVTDSSEIDTIDTETEDSESGDVSYDSGTDTKEIPVDTETSSELPLQRIAIAWEAATAPTIDGNIDEDEWPTLANGYLSNRADRIMLDTHSGSALQPPTTSFDVMWDDDAMYLAMRTDDGNKMVPKDDEELINGDSFEIYIDMPRYETDGIYIRMTGENPMSPGNMESNLDDITEIRAAQQSKGHSDYMSGYSMEVKIPWATLGVDMPTHGLKIGFDIGFNDHDDSTNRDYKALWNGTMKNSDSTEDFGTLIFQETNAPDLIEFYTTETATNSCTDSGKVSWSASNHTIVWEQNVYNASDTAPCNNGEKQVWYLFRQMTTVSHLIVDTFDNRNFKTNVSLMTSPAVECKQATCISLQAVPWPQNDDSSIFQRYVIDNSAMNANITIVISAKDENLPALLEDDVTYVFFSAE
ncbi:MAG: hypothetical protein JXR76_27305 [Deltaproteobacteria bacterium]|nr:hypothetical protein [Deltaproteobacteria bacterium]